METQKKTSRLVCHIHPLHVFLANINKQFWFLNGETIYLKLPKEGIVKNHSFTISL
jgi:hypothetical protein